MNDLNQSAGELTRELQELRNELNELKKSHEQEIARFRKTEQELRASEANLSAVLNASDESIILLAADTTILSLNDVAAQRMGLSREEMTGCSVLEILPPDVAERRSPYIDRALLSGEHVMFEDERDGRWMVNRLHPILNEQGQVTRLAVFSRDITFRKQAEDVLRESKERLRDVLENSLDVSYKRNLHSNTYDYLSPVITRLTGLTMDESNSLPLDSILAMIHPEDRTEIDRVIADALTGPETQLYKVDYRFRHKDGRYRWFHDQFTVRSDANGQPVALIGSITEITGLKEIEASLKVSEKKYRQLVESTPDLVWAIDLQGNLTYCNPAIHELLGYDISEIVSNQTFKHLHPDDETAIREMLKQCIAQKVGWQNTDIRQIHKNGSVRSFESTGSPLFDSEGQLTGFSGIDRDVTGYKQAMEALRENENRLQTLFNTMAEGVILIAPDGQIVQANQAAESILGLSRPDIEKRNYIAADWEILRFDGSPMPTDEMAGPRAFQEKQPIRNTGMGVRRPDGTVTWINVSATPLLNDKGEIKGVVGTFSDISARKEVEDLLKQTHFNYESFFNTIDNFLFILDIQGNIIHVNSVVIDRLGYTREELSGKSVLTVHPPEHRDEAGRIVADMLTGKADHCPVPLMTKSGMQIPVETRVVPGSWNGQPAIFGVTKDISKLKLSEEKFSKLFHLNPSACCLSDLEDHTCLEVNDAFYALFGFERNEVIGKTALDLGILSTGTTNSILQKEDKHGNVVNVEADLKTKQGDTKHVLLSAENIYIQEKKLRYTVVHDVTELKKAQKALMESETHARALIEAIPDLVFVLDKQGVFLDYKSANEDLAYQTGSIIGKKNRDIMPFQFADLLDEQISRTLKTGEVQTFEYQLNLPSKGVREYEARMVVGGEGVVIAIVRDVTDRNQSEMEIRVKNEALYNLVREKDKFFSIIAHDLRSPFQTLLGFTRMMVEELPTLRLDEIQKMAVNMRTSANKLYNLLEWSLMQRNMTTFSPVPFLCKNQVAEIMQFVLNPASLKEIEITSFIPVDLTLVADIKMFESLMRNLLFNAIKFTHKGGKIFIGASLVTGNFVEISIRDTGIGMNKLTIDNLFRLDKQILRKGTEGEPSTGLGLLICKDFVDKHRGEIRVESEVGKGSIFYFTLPCKVQN